MINCNADKIYDDSFGLWVSSLFSAVVAHNPALSFLEQKAAFFDLLRIWLGEGKIVFCSPDDPLGKKWCAADDEIISYLLSRWPVSAESEDDENLFMYFYEIPAIMWVAENGNFVGS